MVESIDLGALYRQGREQVAELVRGLGDEELATPVRACPGWSVHDVVSHLAGVATDTVNGRLQGVPSSDQTAVQVQERAAIPTSIVLREWERTGSQVEMLLTKSQGRHVGPVIDVAVHEQDIRGAVDQPGHREGPLVALAIARAVSGFVSKVESAGLEPVGIGDLSGDLITGHDDAPVKLRMSPFELFRALYGRRSRSQIEARFEGTDDPGPYVSLLCVFSPAQEDIIE